MDRKQRHRSSSNYPSTPYVTTASTPSPYSYSVAPGPYDSQNPSYSSSDSWSRQPYTTIPNRNTPAFLSSEAERALMGEEDEAQRLFHQQAAQRSYAASQASQPFVPSQGWAPTSPPTMSPYGQMPPSLGSRPQMQYSMSSRPQMSSSLSPTPPYAAGQPWPGGYQPDDMEAYSQGPSDISRSVSPSPAELRNFGIPQPDGKSWLCAHAGCTSQTLFTRGCDLRKHYRRHTKHLFCRHEGCPQSREGGFSSKKDRDRHEAKHKPGVSCDWEGCPRKFSRVDNMKDHVRRIHRKNS